MEYWLEYEEKNGRLKVKSYSIGDMFWPSIDGNFEFVKSNGVWKVDSVSFNFEYGSKGKDFTPDQIKGYLEQVEGYRDVLYLGSDRVKVSLNPWESRWETAHKFFLRSPSSPNGEILQYSAYNGELIRS